MTDIAKALQAPFPDSDIEWRAQRSGIKNGKGWAVLLAYVTNRAIQERLDDAVGIENWKNEYLPAPDGGVMCGISIRFDSNDEWITKWDGAENTNVEAVKGGLSGAMKRAAVQWGIGRYLYNLDATVVHLNEVKQSAQDLMIQAKEDPKEKFGKRMFATRPKLPEWALLDDIAALHTKIRLLGKELNHPPSITDERIKTAATVHEAQLIIDDLEARKSKL